MSSTFCRTPRRITAQEQEQAGRGRCALMSFPVFRQVVNELGHLGMVVCFMACPSLSLVIDCMTCQLVHLKTSSLLLAGLLIRASALASSG